MILDYMLSHLPVLLGALSLLAVVAYLAARAINATKRRDRK